MKRFKPGDMAVILPLPPADLGGVCPYVGTVCEVEMLDVAVPVGLFSIVHFDYGVRFCDGKRGAIQDPYLKHIADPDAGKTETETRELENVQ